MRIAINGAGIAGPTLAYWLRKSGHEVLLVEEAPQLRSGGYVIDFWGLGYDIAEKMGLIPRIRELGYQVKEVRFVDRHGRRSGGFSVDVFRRLTNGRFTSLRRSDLAATIYGALDGQVETIFGDSVAGIEDDGRSRAGRASIMPPRARSIWSSAPTGCIRASGSSRSGPKRSSKSRSAITSPRSRSRGIGRAMSSSTSATAVPGRQVSRFSMRDDKTLFLFVFRDEYLPAESPASEQATQIGADERLCRCRLGMPADSRGDGECRRNLFRPRQPDSDGSLDEGPHGADRRCRGLRFSPGGRRHGPGDGGGLCACRRTSRLRGRSRRGLRSLSGAHDAVSEAQAGSRPRNSPRRSPRRVPSASRSATSSPGCCGIPFVADFFIGRDLRDDIELSDYGRQRSPTDPAA